MRIETVGASLLWFGLVVVQSATGQTSAADMQRRHREMQAEHQRRMDEMKRSHEQRTRQLRAEQSQPLPRTTRPAPRPFVERRTPPFNAVTAPPPADCLKSYMAVALGARSMDGLLKYLPLDEQRALKARQANYDPQETAARRARFREMNPNLTESSLTFLTNSPYANQLAHHKRIAAKFLAVLSVKVDGNIAMVSVFTTGGGKVNGVEYPYGTATIEMLGEEGYWKMKSYNDSSVVYLHPPKPNARKKAP